jgi:hypothetical protein
MTYCSFIVLLSYKYVDSNSALHQLPSVYHPDLFIYSSNT